MHGIRRGILDIWDAKFRTQFFVFRFFFRFEFPERFDLLLMLRGETLELRLLFKQFLVL